MCVCVQYILCEDSKRLESGRDVKLDVCISVFVDDEGPAGLSNLTLTTMECGGVTWRRGVLRPVSIARYRCLSERECKGKHGLCAHS